MSSATLLPAIPYPLRNVVCLGKNYKDHVAEMDANEALPAEPIYFSKAAFFLRAPEMKSVFMPHKTALPTTK